MIPATVVGLQASTTRREYTVTLKEITGRQQISFLIGSAEAAAIAAEMEGRDRSRPMIHDVIGQILETNAARLIKILIRRMNDGPHYATLTVKSAKGQHVIYASLGDAIALALRTNAAMLVERKVLYPLENELSGLTEEEQLRLLENKLKDAINLEAYESAAQLRDEIRKIQHQKNL